MTPSQPLAIPPWSIRLAVLEEAEAVRDVALATFREAFSHAMPAGTLDRLLTDRFAPTRFLELISLSTGRIYVAEVGGALVGYALAHPARTPQAHQADWELSRIYVRQAFHGAGVGEALMAACVQAAKAGGASGMWLKVWEHNSRGLAFYRRWGFLDVGREDMDVYGTLLLHLILEKVW